MTDNEKLNLVLSGISARANDYLKVKQMRLMTLRSIQNETGFSIHFITTCRKVAGWKRTKNNEQAIHNK